MVRGFLADQAVHIRYPQAVRPWQHVLEPLAGYISLADHLLREGTAFSGAWNFGPADDDPWPVARIADAMVASWGSGARWVRDTAENPHEAGYLKLDASKARALLGWRPILPLENALRWVVEWFLAWQKGENMQAFTLGQIGEYERLQPKVPHESQPTASRAQS
jgi:CDP-glucose 4,6-dehydratase